MSQIKTMNMQSISPVSKSLFPGISDGGINRKPGGRNHRGSGTQHHQRCLIPDFQTCAGNQSDLPLKRGGLKTFPIIQITAFFAQGIVEKVQLGELFFADIAIPGCNCFSPFMFRIRMD